MGSDVRTDAEIAERLRQSVSRFVRRVRSQADALPPTRSEPLDALLREGPQTIAQLAARRGVKHQSMSRTVAELEALGLVRREASSIDRRASLIMLTAAGTTALEADRIARRDWVAAAIGDRLTPTEREMLDLLPALLDRLSDVD